MGRDVKSNHKGYLAKLRKKLQEAAQQAGQAAADLLGEYLLEKMTEPKSGREYVLPDGDTYTASAPGEYPAIKTGKLSSSIRIISDLSAMKQGRVKFWVGVDPSAHGVDYDVVLYEEMDRKWIPDALEELRPQFEMLFDQSIAFTHEYVAPT